MLAEVPEESSTQNTKSRTNEEKLANDEDDELLELDDEDEEEEEEANLSKHNRRQSRATIRTDVSNMSIGSPIRPTINSADNENEKEKEVTIEEALSKIGKIISSKQEKGAKPYQEDSTCIFYSPDLTVLMGAVFDGHGGINGQIASTKLANMTLAYFQKNWRAIREWTEEQWKKEMAKWFDEMQTSVREGFIQMERTRRRNAGQKEDNIVDSKGVVRKTSGVPIHGGTTATIVTALRRPSRQWQIVCANVGDSDSLLVARKPGRLSTNNKVCTHLTVDHSPDSQSEYLRIKELPSEEYPHKLLFVYDLDNSYRKYECPLVFLENGTKDPNYVNNPWKHNLRPTNVRYDPAVYAVSPSGVSHDVTCIAMTRSLGDFYANPLGLSHHPDLTFVSVDSDHEFLITVASDGIWDCWKWEAFADYLNGLFTKFPFQTDQVVHVALQHTLARAKSCFGESSFDDASLIVISLFPQIFPPFPFNTLPLSSHSKKIASDNASIDHFDQLSIQSKEKQNENENENENENKNEDKKETNNNDNNNNKQKSNSNDKMNDNCDDSDFGRHDDGEELQASLSD